MSIVIPVLNEAQGITQTLQALAPLRARGVQVIVVDGGSTDGTVERARQALQAPVGNGVAVVLYGEGAAPWQVLRSPPGRAVQMNTGAQQARAATLLFLHADTLLPPAADTLVTQALNRGTHHWGRFDVHITGQHGLLRVVAALMNRRSRWSGIATGDQALFMTRAAFDTVGGFPAQPLMEDIEMSKRLLRLSRPACLHQRVATSGRRWETRGVWRTVLLMWRLRFAYWRGVSPQQLAQWYR
ncbi:TIGR04283 family arsenosugar biosynthesis glycosyltransferase [Rhodoferax sp. AJA081-3]|nr:TIGR04283 family arsenosugar biosynthesis glycosyltransferase [Rhodoferax sp. AJA081-3]